MYSKGDISSAVLISIIIAIVALAISLYFVSTLGGQLSGESDTCKLSILTRATAPSAAQSLVPLKCTTGKICITSDSLLNSLGDRDSCDQFIGEKGVTTIRLTGNTIEKEEKIKAELAGAMYDCWSMTGQGKLDLFGDAAKYYGGGGEPTCVICSRVSFSDNVPDSLIQNALVGLDSYLQTTAIPGQSITFLSAFNNQGTSTFTSVKNAQDALSSSSEADSGSTNPVSITQSNNRQLTFVFSQVHVDDTAQVLGRLGAAAAGATFAIPGAAKGASALFLGKAAIVAVPVVGAVAFAVGVNNEAARGAAAGYCGEIESASGNLRSGCSIVQALPYTVENVNKMCPGSIQGNP